MTHSVTYCCVGGRGAGAEIEGDPIPLLFLGVGYVSKMGDYSLKYQVSSAKDLAIIIEHFDKYPLITQKLADYKLFKQAVELIKRKEHLRVGRREV